MGAFFKVEVTSISNGSQASILKMVHGEPTDQYRESVIAKR